MKPKLLLADDDAEILLNCISKVLDDVGPFDIEIAETPEITRAKLKSGKFSVVLLDLSFSPGNKEGLSLISAARHLSPATAVIMLTSYSDTDTISKCMGLGATDFLVKQDFENLTDMRNNLGSILSRVAKHRDQADGGARLALKVGATFKSTVMKSIYSKLFAIIDESRMHVLVTGETGVGKELIASALSKVGSGAPFCPVNSSCFGKDLLEGELFGHEKGAYTGADKQKIGFFEKADGGVIFLDEIATLSLEHQAKLLRVLQSGEFYRVGGTKLLKTTARVVAATNEDLNLMVKSGLFREDLLQRLERYRIHVPPLRERKEDISPIVDSIIQRSTKSNIKLGPNVLQVLESFDWPQNVRQLENAIQSAILMSDGSTIMLGDLPGLLFSSEDEAANSGINVPSQRLSDYTNLPMEAATQKFGAAYMMEMIRKISAPLTLDALAIACGLSKSSVQRRLKDYGIDINTAKLVATAKEGNVHD